MSKRILALPESVASKIAAGEVVERPATVVKELVENAIDAGAKAITVAIEKGGKALIRVTDDGDGIEAEDLDLVFTRHATSKIATAEDLYRIETLGFRGEALASISVVSRLELITRTEEAAHGTSVKRVGPREVERIPASSPRGSSVIVRDLFFNTPARLKFLKTDKSEERKITDLMSKLALSHPDVRFKYTADDRDQFTTPGDGKVFNAIFALYGKDVAKDLLYVETTEGEVNLQGYISKLSLSRGNKQLQTFFVNGRFVENNQIDEALQSAYRGKLMAYRHPVAFLFFDVPPEAVDVNIHPAKTEIKFDERLPIKNLVYTTVLRGLKTHDLTPEVRFEKKEGPKASPVDRHPPENKLEPVKDRGTPASLSEGRGRGMGSAVATGSRKTAPVPTPVDLEDLVVPDALFDAPVEAPPSPREADPTLLRESETVYDDLRIIGQLLNTFILAEARGRLYLIDQHAAHEKINYETFMAAYREKSVASQLLMTPMTFTLPPLDYDRVLERKELLGQLGLAVESFGHRQIAVREVPVLFNHPVDRPFVERLLEGIAEESATYAHAEERIVEESCKRAIRAKDTLSAYEIDDLIAGLKKLEDPYTCPHGRPIMVYMERSEIERKFKRT